MPKIRPDARRNLVSLLGDLTLRPDRPAFALRSPYRRFVWTAGQTRAAALGLAAQLIESGLRSGEPVLIQGPNSPEWVAAFLGIAAAGGVVVPLDEAAPVELCGGVAATVGARRAVVASEAAPAWSGISSDLRTLESLRALRGRLEPSLVPYQASPDDTAEIVFTSGTTAKPKGVELSHANLLVNLAGIEHGFRKRETWLRWLLPMRFFCLVPLSHMLGQSVGLFIPILFRSLSIFSTSLEPARLLSFIRREKPLAVLTVPRTLSGLAQAARRELDRRGLGERFASRIETAAALSVWRRILATRDIRKVIGWRTWVLLSGGAELDPAVEEFWARCGFAVVQGYGMTEAAPIVTIHNPLEGRRRTIGRRVGAQEVRLEPDGEILVRGPNVMKGYFGDPEATREALKDGWLHTGDLAEQDAEGRLFFKGRKKDLIVTSEGMNVFPADVERVLDGVAGVRESVVFPLKGSSGEEVHAAVITDDPRRDTESIRAEANARLLSHQRLRGVTIWDGGDFPRTSTGKPRRREVAALMPLARAANKEATGALADRRAPSRVSRAAGTIARLRPELAADKTPSGRLSEDLGLGSLEIVELIGLLEEEHGVVVDEKEIPATLTVADLDRLLSEGGRQTLRISMPRWARGAPIRMLRAIIRELLVHPVYALFVRLEVRGRENLRGLSPPFLIVSNHTSFLDVGAVLFALPPRLRGRLAPAMAIETLPEHFEPEGTSLGRRLRSAFWYNLAVFLFNTYPLPQSRGFRPSLEYTGELLDAGFCPLVFPEGRVTRDGRMHPFKAGIGLLAMETREAVLPLRLEGLFEILPPTARWPSAGRAQASLAAPLRPEEWEGADANAATRKIENAVRAAAKASV